MLQKKPTSTYQANGCNNFCYLLWQFFPDKSIHPSTRNGAQQSNYNYRNAGTNLCIQWAGTGTCNGPAGAKQQATIDLPLAKGFFAEHNRFAMNGFDAEALDEPYRNHAHHHSTANNPIHVKGLKAEHFLYAEPTDDFRFYKHDTKGHTYYEVLKVLVPFGFLLALVQTNGIQRTHFKICIFFCCLHDFFLQ